MKLNGMASRKFLFSGAMWGTSTAMLWFGKLPVEAWQEMSWIILGVYVGGNAIEHVAGALKKGPA